MLTQLLSIFYDDGSVCTRLATAKTKVAKQVSIPFLELCGAIIDAGQIDETHLRNDGLTRVVSVKGCNGLFKNPLTKLCAFPIPEDNTMYTLYSLQHHEEQ